MMIINDPSADIAMLKTIKEQQEQRQTTALRDLLASGHAAQVNAQQALDIPWAALERLLGLARKRAN